MVYIYALGKVCATIQTVLPFYRNRAWMQTQEKTSLRFTCQFKESEPNADEDDVEGTLHCNEYLRDY